MTEVEKFNKLKPYFEEIKKLISDEWEVKLEMKTSGIVETQISLRKKKNLDIYYFRVSNDEFNFFNLILNGIKRPISSIVGAVNVIINIK